MKRTIIFCLMAGAIFLSSCVREPEGDVAINVRENLDRNEGLVSFDVDEKFRLSSKRNRFQILASVTLFDQNRKINCTAGELGSSDSGQRRKWVQIDHDGVMSYRRSDDDLEIYIDGISVAICNVSAAKKLELYVGFRAEPEPMTWSGEGMFGFKVLLPE